jgi:beta-galactosidase
VLAAGQRVFVDGQEHTARARPDSRGLSIALDAPTGAEGEVDILVPAGGEAALKGLLSVGNDSASVQYLTPAPPWRRRLFQGLAQVLTQAGTERADSVLTASAPGLASAKLVLRATP